MGDGVGAAKLPAGAGFGGETTDRGAEIQPSGTILDVGEKVSRVEFRAPVMDSGGGGAIEPIGTCGAEMGVGQRDFFSESYAPLSTPSDHGRVTPTIPPLAAFKRAAISTAFRLVIAS